MPRCPSPAFSWVSPAFGLVYGAGSVTGWTRAVATAVVPYRVRLPAGFNPRPRVRVNGSPAPVAVEDGYALFRLPLRAGAYADWVIE